MVSQCTLSTASGDPLVMSTGPPAAPVGIDGARQRHEAVRVRRPQHRAVVVVAQGEGVGQRVVEGEVLPAVVAHGEHAVLGPLVLGLHVRADEGARWCPGASSSARPASCGRGRRCTRRCPRTVSRWKGSSVLVAPAGPGLGEVPEGALRMVVEAPDPGVRAVVVVEGAVLLHEEHDVLNGAEVRAGRLGARRELRHGGAGPVAAARPRPGRPPPPVASAAASSVRRSKRGAVEAHRRRPSRVVLTWAPRPPRSRLQHPAVRGPDLRRPLARRVRSHGLDECRIVVAHVTDARPDGVVHDRAGGRRAAAAPAIPRRPRWPGRARRRRWRGRG